MKPLPLVILGLDAGDPNLILRWARDGTLPAIGSVLDRGVHATLSGPDMASTHGVWMSILTGLSLREHGRYVTRVLVPGTYDLRPVDALSPPAQPFWASLRGQDRRVVVVDAPGVGLVAGLPGAQIADWGRDQAGRSPSSEPASLIADVCNRFGRPRMVDETQGTRWRDRRMYRRLQRRIASKGELARSLISIDATDVIVVVFADTHAGGHRFRKYGSIEGPLCQIYRAIDREIGLLLEGIRASANLFIVSSGGITDGQPSWAFMDAFCRALGYQAEVDPRSGWQRSITDLWRRARSRALGGRSSAGDMLPTTLDGTDWERTTAFAIPSYYTGLVRVNLKGREPRGTVRPGSEYDALLERLEGDLRRLVHGETGQPVVTSITRTAPMNGGAPCLQLPDLFVEWRIDPRTRRIVHPNAILDGSRYGNPRMNYHSRTGLVIAAGPSVTSRGLLTDIAPSELHPIFLALLAGAEARWPVAGASR